MKQTTRITILACLVLAIYILVAVAICFKEELIRCCMILKEGLLVVSCVLEMVLIAAFISIVLKNKEDRETGDMPIISSLIVVNTAAALAIYLFFR
jgi:hypothetical protein